MSEQAVLMVPLEAERVVLRANGAPREIVLGEAAIQMFDGQYRIVASYAELPQALVWLREGTKPQWILDKLKEGAYYEALQRGEEWPTKLEASEWVRSLRGQA